MNIKLTIQAPPDRRNSECRGKREKKTDGCHKGVKKTIRIRQQGVPHFLRSGHRCIAERTLAILLVFGCDIRECPCWESEVHSDSPPGCRAPGWWPSYSCGCKRRTSRTWGRHWSDLEWKGGELEVKQNSGMSGHRLIKGRFLVILLIMFLLRKPHSKKNMNVHLGFFFAQFQDILTEELCPGLVRV